MPDLAHVFGSDLSVALTGDLATVDTDTWTQQRILRRLLTNLGGYIWQPGYGGGLPAMIGTPVSLGQIQGIVTTQMALETAVDQTQPITVTVVTNNAGTVSLTVAYTDAASGLVTTLDLPPSLALTLT